MKSILLRAAALLMLGISAVGLVPNSNAAPISAPAKPALVIDTGHSDLVNEVVFSPDSRMFASAGNDRTIILHDSVDGRWKKTLRGHNAAINSLAFAPDGKLLASGDAANRVILWDVATGASVRELIVSDLNQATGIETANNASSGVNGATTTGIVGIAMAQTENLLAAASRGGTIRFWNTATGALDGTVQSAAERPTFLAFSADSKRLFSGDDDLPLEAWNSRTGIAMPLPDAGPAPGVRLALTPAGDRVMYRTPRGQLTVWDTVAGKQATAIQPPRASTAATFHPGGKGFVGLLGMDLVVVWNENGQILQAFDTGQDMIGFNPATLAIAPDGRSIALASRNGTLKLWDLQSGKLRARLPSFSMRVSCVLGGPIPGWATGAIIGCYQDGSIFVWDDGSGRLIKTLRNPGRTVATAALSPGGSMLAVSLGWPSFTHTMSTQGVPFQELQFWNTQTWTLTRTIKLVETDQGVAALAFSPDGRTLAGGTRLGGYDSVSLWDAATGAEKRPLGQESRLHPSGIAFSRDSKLLASSSESGYGVQVWDLTAQKSLLHNFNGSSYKVYGLVFLPNGKIALASSRGLCLFDIASKKWAANIEKVSEASSAIALSADTASLATNTRSGAVKLWDTASWKFKGYLLPNDTAESNAIGAKYIAFTRDSKKVVTDAPDGSLKIWNAANGQPLLTLQVLPSIVLDSDAPEWISYTSGGHYTGSPNAAKFVHLTNAPGATVAEIEGKLVQPDLVYKSLNPAP